MPNRADSKTPSSRSTRIKRSSRRIRNDLTVAQATLAAATDPQVKQDTQAKITALQAMIASGNQKQTAFQNKQTTLKAQQAASTTTTLDGKVTDAHAKVENLRNAEAAQSDQDVQQQQIEDRAVRISSARMSQRLMKTLIPMRRPSPARSTPCTGLGVGHR